MTFDAEWAGIKADVAAGGPVTRLASAGDGDSGSGSGDVVSAPQAWRTAAAGVEAVAGNAAKALSTMDLLQEGVRGLKCPGVESLGAQRALFDSWKSYLGRVRTRTTALQGQFTMAGKAQHDGDTGTGSLLRKVGEDARIASGISSVTTGDAYRDTPRLGGGPDLLEA